MEALGRLYDLSTGVAIQDAHTSAITGKRVSLKHATSVSVVLIKAAGTAGDDPVLTFSSASAASGGSLTTWPNPSTTVPGATPQYYYKKAAPSPTGAETWSKVAAVASSGVITLTGESTNAGIYVIPINPTDIVTGQGGSAGGFPDYLEVDIGSLGHTQYVTILFALNDLQIQEDPTRMSNSQT
jgi:hypothetical protein